MRNLSIEELEIVFGGGLCECWDDDNNTVLTMGGEDVDDCRDTCCNPPPIRVVGFTYYDQGRLGFHTSSRCY